MQTIGMLKRSFKFLSRDSFLFLYRTIDHTGCKEVSTNYDITYIRSHLEYHAPSWSPYLVKDIDTLEQVQHHATKLVKNLSTLPDENQLVSL